MGQKATVKTLYGITDWFKMTKGVGQGYLLSSCLFNLYSEHIMRNAELDELQAGIKIGGRNINNLRYLDDATLMAESEKELKSLLMKVKEESERASLRLNIGEKKKKKKDHGIWPHYCRANRRRKGGSGTDFLFLGSRITADSDCSHEIKTGLLLGRKMMTKSPYNLVTKRQTKSGSVSCS